MGILQQGGAAQAHAEHAFEQPEFEDWSCSLKLKLHVPSDPLWQKAQAA